MGYREEYTEEDERREEALNRAVATTEELMGGEPFSFFWRTSSYEPAYIRARFSFLLMAMTISNPCPLSDILRKMVLAESTAAKNLANELRAMAVARNIALHSKVDDPIQILTALFQTIGWNIKFTYNGGRCHLHLELSVEGMLEPEHLVSLINMAREIAVAAKEFEVDICIIVENRPIADWWHNYKTVVEYGVNDPPPSFGLNALSFWHYMKKHPQTIGRFIVRFTQPSFQIE